MKPILENGNTTTPPQKKSQTIPWPMKSYTVKENHIGSAVKEIENDRNSVAYKGL